MQSQQGEIDELLVRAKLVLHESGGTPIASRLALWICKMSPPCAYERCSAEVDTVRIAAMTKVIVIVTDTFLYINFPVIYYFFLELAFGILLEINRSDHGQLKKIGFCKYVEEYIQALDIVPLSSCGRLYAEF